jgi:hypothetical protein
VRRRLLLQHVERGMRDPAFLPRLDQCFFGFDFFDFVGPPLCGRLSFYANFSVTITIFGCLIPASGHS